MTSTQFFNIMKNRDGEWLRAKAVGFITLCILMAAAILIQNLKK
jgi:hypothetical protein